MTGFDYLHSVNRAVTNRAVTDTESSEVHSEVYIEVGVLPSQVAPVRVVAADLAARADFDLDAVADLRMAVDEACSTLATLAGPESRMQCRIRVEPDQIIVTVRIPSPRIGMVPQNTFGWRVLATLTDEVEVLGQDGADPLALGIRLVKHRQGAA